MIIVGFHLNKTVFFIRSKALLIAAHPPVVSWLVTRVDFVPSLRIAFKWMVRAFSGYLSTDQLLLLWDRILGYDSLEIVAGITLIISLSVYIKSYTLSFLHFFCFSAISLPSLHLHLSLYPLLHFTFLHLYPFSSSDPVLAAAVFAFRAENLMEVTSLASAEVWPFHISLLCVCLKLWFQSSPCPPTYPWKAVNSSWWPARTSNPVFCMHMSGKKKDT